MSSARFNAQPKLTKVGGTGNGEAQRIKAVRGEWGSTMNELDAHKNEGIQVEPIRRAKIAHGLQRDHHRHERTSGKTRGIIKGRV